MVIPKPTKAGRRRRGRRVGDRVIKSIHDRILKAYGGRQPEVFVRHRELDKQALDLWSKVVEMLQGPFCQCGCMRSRFGGWVMGAHHLFGKTACWSTRYDPQNGAFLAWPCHDRVQHDHEANYALGIKLLGQAEYDKLNVRAHSGSKTDVKVAIITLTEMLKQGGKL